ncbi:NAD-dependent epimerase/dehydratase family protein [Sphingomonas turrisvirgatae]|uniref:CDP-paratose 2-epimerase n=1 Tax=Sphingomonas turrisvirgatae TaxID=1888892 RepID=A0A1E3LRS7_9SPHN|nr:NAD-dependent epimerase/dehydratase family protein [Sphingomonas turrisvirgatae]ODP36448.1 CDP-paratose 2-epimerase [Sphingomonas turrisvirgatae]
MTPAADRPILVTGGAGFIGCNIADRLAGQGNRVIVYDALSRPGVERNLAWLQRRHGDLIQPVIADIRDGILAETVRDARAVFHMAAQVAVTTSLADPREDFEINIGGTFAVLEAARQASTPPPVIFASTNKVYGDLADLEFVATDRGYLPADAQIRRNGIGEQRPLDFHTPYGCSKGAADQYVLDYARSFGLPAAVLRMSCIYGERQMGTEDQGWVAHFLIRALQDQPITLYGDGQQVRDILDVGDAVDAYLAAWQRIDRIAGRAFNLGGGAANAVSLRVLIDHIGRLIGREPTVGFDDWRAGDQRYFVADTRAARSALGLAAPLPWRDGVARLATWLAGERGIDLPAHAAQAPVLQAIAL